LLITAVPVVYTRDPNEDYARSDRKNQPWKTRKPGERITVVLEKTEQHGRVKAIFKNKFAQLSAEIGRLIGGMRALSDEVLAQKTQIAVGGLSPEFAELRREI
jgi:hypothetical protein